jgi:predicted RNA binding protein YcfA (HicA-like mRNA interferase family)
MATDLYRRLVQMLRTHGCEMVRQGKGSHEIWHSPITGRHVSVPVTVKSRHTANAVLKQAGLADRL